MSYRWHVMAGRTWLVKGSTRVVNDRTREEQRRYVADNPHQQQIRDVFAAAHIEYGRIDYGIANGRLRVYEINTNPAIGGAGRRRGPHRRQRTDASVSQLIEAFTSLAGRCPAPGSLIRLTPRRGVLRSLGCTRDCGMGKVSSRAMCIARASKQRERDRKNTSGEFVSQTVGPDNSPDVFCLTQAAAISPEARIL